MHFKRKLTSLVTTIGVVGVALAVSLSQAAAEYPERKITMIYNYGAGSTVETTFRVIAEEASKIIGQPVVIENKPGAGGRIGAEALLNAEPDGYTVGVINNSVGVNQVILKPELYFDIPKDVTPVLEAFGGDLVFVAKSELPFDDIPSMVAYAQENPGELVFGTAGQGTTTHVGLGLLRLMADFDVNVVHYKGATATNQALLSGEIDLALQDQGVVPFIDEGKVKALGVTGRNQWSEFFPGVKTVAEQGEEFANYEFSWFQSISLPGGASDEVVAFLNGAFNQALLSEPVQEKMVASGQIFVGGSSEDAIAKFNDTRELLRPILEAVSGN